MHFSSKIRIVRRKVACPQKPRIFLKQRSMLLKIRFGACDVAFSSFLGEPTYYQPLDREEAYIEEYKIQKQQKEENLLKILKDH